MLKQKLVGLGMILVGILPMIVLKDGTFSVVAFAIGGYLMITKRDCLI